MIKNAMVEIVFDSSKGKLRAQAQDGGFVRFPNDLRVRGARYLVSLKSGKSGSWIVTGAIQELTVGQRVR